MLCYAQMLSHVCLFVTPWTVAHRLFCPWDSPGKNTGVSYHSLLQGIFPTQGSNPGLLPLLADCLPPEPPRKLGPNLCSCTTPFILEVHVDIYGTSRLENAGQCISHTKGLKTEKEAQVIYVIYFVDTSW